MKKLKLNKVLVIGLGFRTGLSSANFLADNGSLVFVSDMKSREELKDLIKKLNPEVQVITGHQKIEILDENFDSIILSPGVPKSIKLVQEALKKEIPVISEIELAYHFLKGKIVAITGTDGKSTTTTLVGHIFKELGYNSFIGGNIGIPMISFAGQTDDDSISVIELSSYQLETIDEFKPDVSAILNISPDHLDRYDGMASYFETKKRIVMNQSSDDFYVYNLDDRILTGSLDNIKSRKLSFSLNSDKADIFFRNGNVVISKTGENVCDVSKLTIMGVHNVYNVMSAILMVTSLLGKIGADIDFEKIANACYSFPGLEHRMELIGEVEKRIFINDSKATTIGAVEMALKSITGSGVLILGGKTKGDDYNRLKDIMPDNIKAIVLIGESKDEFAEIFSKFKCVKADDFDDAVMKSVKLSSEGDSILLSPACASFDMFKSYEERGKVFKESVNKLKRGELSWT